MAIFTNRLNLQKPAGGSSGTIPGDDPADIDVINDNSDKIDAAVGVRYVTSTTRPATPYDGQLIKETDTGKLLVYRQGISDWEDAAPGLRGSTALRDLYYGTPGTPALRVALANKDPRWFNTDKGFEQVYCSQFDDAGATIRNSAATHGWKAVGRCLVHATTLTTTGGTAVDQGDRVVITGSNGVLFQGIFTDDFEDYEVEFFGSAGVNPTNLTFRVANGAVLETTAGIYGPNTLSIVNASVVGAYAGANVAVISDLGGPATKSPARLSIYGPKLASYTTYIADGLNISAGRQWRSAGSVQNLTSYDGFWISAAGMTGYAKVYGIGR